jgi:hypothetical protein
MKRTVTSDNERRTSLERAKQSMLLRSSLLGSSPLLFESAPDGSGDGDGTLLSRPSSPPAGGDSDARLSSMATSSSIDYIGGDVAVVRSEKNKTANTTQCGRPVLTRVKPHQIRVPTMCVAAIRYAMD